MADDKFQVVATAETPGDASHWQMVCGAIGERPSLNSSDNFARADPIVNLPTYFVNTSPVFSFSGNLQEFDMAVADLLLNPHIGSGQMPNAAQTSVLRCAGSRRCVAVYPQLEVHSEIAAYGLEPQGLGDAVRDRAQFRLTTRQCNRRLCFRPMLYAARTNHRAAPRCRPSSDGASGKVRIDVSANDIRH